LLLGCDFHFSYDNLIELDQDPQQFTISDTQYLLVELSNFSVPQWVTLKLEELLAYGIQPIITHPERNLLLQRRPEQIIEWARMGCAVQVTANSLTGRWGPKAGKTAQWLLQKRAVHIIATDCHNVEGRPPILSQAFNVLEKTYGGELANALVTENPLAVLENRELSYLPT
jgi:protein-tyrosine phosphatase